MKTYKIKIEIELTAKDIEDILSSALRGCTYWADECKLNSKVPTLKDLMMSQALTHGHKLKIHEAMQEKWHLVTIDSFLKALSKTPNFPYDDYDQYDAERILQKAIFGRVVYG